MTEATEIETPAKGEPAPATPDPLFSAEEVARILDFHGTPVAAQVLREVLGTLGRTAAWAARKQPKNRPEWLRAWNPPHLRLLAELCATHAPDVGTITSPREQIPMREVGPDELGGQHYAVAGPPLPHEVDAEIFRTEAELLAERAEKTQALALLTEQLGAEPISPNGSGTYGPTDAERFSLREPDPFNEAAPAGLPVIHWADPLPPTDAEESRSLIGREQGEPPF
jgi:hypothetical protein